MREFYLFYLVSEVYKYIMSSGSVRDTRKWNSKIPSNSSDEIRHDTA